MNINATDRSDLRTQETTNSKHNPVQKFKVEYVNIKEEPFDLYDETGTANNCLLMIKSSCNSNDEINTTNCVDVKMETPEKDEEEMNGNSVFKYNKHKEQDKTVDRLTDIKGKISKIGRKMKALQLWQFLVLLLDSPEGIGIIRWTGRGLEFKLVDPDAVAKRWGAQKNRPAMNYEKLSRAFRYYYEKGIMKKVTGNGAYVYKFVCDPKNLEDVRLLHNGTSSRELQYSS